LSSELEAAAGLAPLVLVVDDYQDGREACAEYLAFAGFRVTEASDGAEALRKAFAELPDAVLMDLSLPVIDGWECMVRLRADERTRHMLVIALTAHALDAYVASARDAGADSVITKPCVLPELVQAIRRGLAARDLAKAERGGGS
jgi:two-component system cell cycle response regulator DivK